MRKHALVIAVLFVLATPCASRAHDEYLEPEDEGQAVAVDHYYAHLLPLLHAGFSPVPAARYTVVPSFGPEYAWSLERGDDGGSFLLTHRLGQNFWYTGCKETNTRSIAIGKDLHDAVARLFSTVTRGIRKMEKNWYKTDGVKYYFSVAGSDGTLVTGSTHSPDEGSLLRRLTRLCNVLMFLPDLEGVSESAVVAEIDALLRDMQMAEEGGSLGEWQESTLERRLREYRERGPEVVPQEKLKEVTDRSAMSECDALPLLLLEKK